MVAETVQANARLLQQLLDQVSDLNQMLGSGLNYPASAAGNSLETGFDLERNSEQSNPHQACDAERQRLEDQIGLLEDQLGDLRQQNRDLAAKVADKSVRNAISDTGAAQALSWEQRKQLILQQMEEECFDADEFVANMSCQSQDPRETPEMFLERLVRDLESRNQEIQELRHLLEQQSQTHSGQIAIGAAAIAEMIDNDELVQQERQRLQALQSEWEEKFREGEIEASLERAKLSRERQELAKRKAELEEELEHVRREQNHQHGGTKSVASRRWLVKLGLSDSQ